MGSALFSVRGCIIYAPVYSFQVEWLPQLQLFCAAYLGVHTSGVLLTEADRMGKRGASELCRRVLCSSCVLCAGVLCCGLAPVAKRRRGLQALPASQ